MIKRIFIALALLLLAIPCSGATYSFYFSYDAQGRPAGNDSTGDGSYATPWKTLSKAETMANSYTSADTVNLYFDGGDTWTCDTPAIAGANSCFTVDRSEAIVNILSYGSGKAVFDGQADDPMSTESNSDCPSNAPCSSSRFFEFKSPGSITNVEIKNVYGSAILINSYDGGSCGTRDCADGFVLSSSLIHNIGMSAIQNNYSAGIEDSRAEYNTIYIGQQLHRYGLISVGQGGAISFTASGGGSNSMCKNNVVRYNLVYDIHGEGINAPNSQVIYNVVGDTESVSINTSQHDFDALTATVAYNFVINSANGVYGPSTGIRVFDEALGGTNSAADISVYGNIVINKTYGIRFQDCNLDCTNPFGVVRIYNNLVIDCTTRNYWVGSTSEVTNGYFYNNASIHYDELNEAHTNSPAAGNWVFSHNAFWPVDVDDTVGTVFQTNYVTGDPVIPGEPSIDWDGLTGAGYYNTIDFVTNLYPTSGALIGAGNSLSSPSYENSYLTTGAVDYANVLSGGFDAYLVDQSTSWDIGPWARGAAFAPTYPLQGVKLTGAVYK